MFFAGTTSIVAVDTVHSYFNGILIHTNVLIVLDPVVHNSDNTHM